MRIEIISPADVLLEIERKISYLKTVRRTADIEYEVKWQLRQRKRKLLYRLLGKNVQTDTLPPHRAGVYPSEKFKLVLARLEELRAILRRNAVGSIYLDDEDLWLLTPGAEK